LIDNYKIETISFVKGVIRQIQIIDINNIEMVIWRSVKRAEKTNSYYRYQLNGNDNIEIHKRHKKTISNISK
jgi:hypothetical protein